VTNTYRPGFVTSSSLCEFDVDETRPGNQFRLVYTPDNSTSIFKLNASNPGQYYYNVLHYNDPAVSGDESVTFTIPFPFVTQGANPVHVYTSFSTTGSGDSLCMLPQDGTPFPIEPIVLTTYDPQTFGTTTTVTVTGLPPNTSYVNIHLDYGLKRTTGYTRAGTDGLDADGPIWDIFNFQAYTFSNGPSLEWIVESVNSFKKNPGGGGNVRTALDEPIIGEQFQMFDSRGKQVGATATSDEDGWYFINYKHTGKAAPFTIRWLRTGQVKSITLRANGTSEANFP
jgi:hypothetical protein